MKKLIAGLLAGCLFSAMLGGCAAKAPDSGANLSSDDAPVRIVCTIFPIYDWLRELTVGCEEQVELTMLLDNGVDLHSYQPSAADMALLSSCDLFVYVGGESDGWARDAVRAAGVPAVSLLDELGSAAKSEQLLEGMTGEESDESSDSEEPEYDEHVWLSLKNAQLFCSRLADRLAELDPEHAELYQSNAAAYQGKLQTLDEQFAEAVDAAPRKVLVFADRYPFCYLAADYGLTCYAAFPGCSAETEASFETVAFLAQKVTEYSLPAVLTIEGARHQLAQTVLAAAKGSDACVLTMDSMQSVTADAAKSGTTYLSLMEQNLGVLRASLK